jgi:uncharacterized protein YjiS (DUF1127 family)
MSMTTSTTSSPALSSAGFLSSLASLAGRVQEYFRVRKAMEELRSLSPESLKDIGIDRSEIERIVRFGR